MTCLGTDPVMIQILTKLIKAIEISVITRCSNVSLSHLDVNTLIFTVCM